MVVDARFSSERLGCERIHSHDYSVIAAVEGGTIQMNIVDRILDLNKGTICFIPAGFVHRILSTSMDFSGVHVLSMDCSILASSGDEAAPRNLVHDEKLYRRFVQWMQDYYDADEAMKGALTGSIMQILEQCGVDLSNELKEDELTCIHWVPLRLKKMMDTGVGADACFRHIEDKMPFSKEHCNRLFKKCYGTTIQAYSLNSRTERARLLLKSELSLSELAAEVGFYDQSQFTKAFRSIFQLTPAAYRKQLRGILDQSGTRNI
ncbi:AraC family transcriptional regulator [Rubritalea spongiae]